jgi:acyl-CoA thioester hydrolase
LKDYQYRLELDVRDYECDLAGIVNNANYLHYLEHARGTFGKAVGLDFAEWAKRGIYFSVIRVEIDYLFPLRSGDRFFVGTNTERISPLRFGCAQDIYRIPDDKPIARAKVVLTIINEKGRPQLPKEIEELFTKDLFSSP